MMHLRRLSAVLLLLTTGTACAGEGPSPSGACDGLAKLADSDGDASPVIAQCLSQLEGGTVLDLAPGRYHLRTPLAITRPVMIRSKPTRPPGACRKTGQAGCAVLIIDRMIPQPGPGIMPVEIRAAHVRLRSLAIIGGTNRDETWEKRVCLDEHVRPLGGGLRVRGSDFRMEDVLLRDISCYTALEIVPQAMRPVVRNSTIGPNGHHGGQMWADGLTVHDTIGATITNNLFVDNTDVQLIFGGCRDCTISENVFRHSGSPARASFAELMLHAWPNTSGDFSGSATSGNDIDCGPARLCGFGIMIGGEPWYPARTFGGSVSGNRIASALLGLNVDRLTGGMTIRANVVKASGGYAPSDCGPKTWPSANVSPSSVRFIRTDMKGYGSLDTTRCLLLH